VKSGERVTLSAGGSSDPDGDALAYEWFYYGEPGTLLLQSGRTGAPLSIENATSADAWFTAPAVTQSHTMHIVLAVTDRGTPPLTRYQRVLVTVQPAVAAVKAPQVGRGPAVLQQPPEWYASPEARASADAVLLVQELSTAEGAENAEPDGLSLRPRRARR
jgi:hypothetical protein